MEKKKSCKTDLEKLRNMKDEDIDFSDIPELGPDFWENAELIVPEKKKGITFYGDNGKEAGKLTFNDGVFRFEGKAEESARVFFAHLEQFFKKELENKQRETNINTRQKPEPGKAGVPKHLRDCGNCRYWNSDDHYCQLPEVHKCKDKNQWDN